MENHKKALFDYVLTDLNAKIDEAQQAIDSATESRNSDTKSSAGDKHETGRAMVQIELDKSKMQLAKALTLKSEMSRIDPLTVCDKVEFGSLVTTNLGIYFMAIGIGKVNLKGADFFVISLASPIGQSMLSKKQGDVINFQGRQFEIAAIE